MSQQINSSEKSFEAAADLSAGGSLILKLDSAGKVVLAAAATDAICGVLQNKPKSGEMALVRFGWTAKVKLGGTVAVGELVTSGAAGVAVKATVAGSVVLGRALEGGVSGDVVEVMVHISTLALGA